MDDVSAPAQASAVYPVWETTPVMTWLVVEGWRCRNPGELITALAERLQAAGVPVWRSFLVVPSLHPQYVGTALTYREGQPLECNRGTYEAMQRREARSNPLLVVSMEGAAAFRRRLTDDLAEDDFPLVLDLQSQGATDYVALPLEFSTGKRTAISFTTRHPNGFSTAQLTELNDLALILARIVEAHSLRATATNLLDTYVGHEAGERIMSGDIRRGSSESIFAALWYCDLRGFTQLSDSMGQSTLVATLNQYFEVMAQAIHGQGGQILKFIGDAVLAIFPVAGPQEAGAACDRALTAALASEEGMAKLNAARTQFGQPPLDFGLALHVGDVMYGNIGAADRLDFTVIGPAVNVAQRIEHLYRQIERRPLLSEAFAAAVSAPATSLGQHELPGVAGVCEVFALDGELAQSQPAIESRA